MLQYVLANIWRALYSLASHIIGNNGNEGKKRRAERVNHYCRCRKAWVAVETILFEFSSDSLVSLVTNAAGSSSWIEVKAVRFTGSNQFCAQPLSRLKFFLLFSFRRQVIMASPFILSRTLLRIDMLWIWGAVAPWDSVVVGPGFPSTDFSVWPGPKGVKLASDTLCRGASSDSFLIGASFACGNCDFSWMVCHTLEGRELQRDWYFINRFKRKKERHYVVVALAIVQIFWGSGSEGTLDDDDMDLRLEEESDDSDYEPSHQCITKTTICNHNHTDTCTFTVYITGPTDTHAYQGQLILLASPNIRFLLVCIGTR